MPKRAVHRAGATHRREDAAPARPVVIVAPCMAAIMPGQRGSRHAPPSKLDEERVLVVDLARIAMGARCEKPQNLRGRAGRDAGGSCTVARTIKTLARGVHASRSMPACVDVSFRGVQSNPSIEAAAHRWLVRLEPMIGEVRRCALSIEPAGRRRTVVCLTVTFADWTSVTCGASQPDAYVAISDAFRGVRRQVLERKAIASPRWPALAISH
jgi:hypothetical protein